MASTGLGVTIGSHSLRGVKLRRKGAGFVVQKIFSERVDDATRAAHAVDERRALGSPARLAHARPFSCLRAY